METFAVARGAFGSGVLTFAAFAADGAPGQAAAAALAAVVIVLPYCCALGWDELWRPPQLNR